MCPFNWNYGLTTPAAERDINGRLLIILLSGCCVFLHNAKIVALSQNNKQSRIVMLILAVFCKLVCCEVTDCSNACLFCVLYLVGF